MAVLLMKLMRNQRGVSALEYAILAAVIIGAVILAVTVFGDGLGEAFDTLTGKVTESVENAGNNSGTPQ